MNCIQSKITEMIYKDIVKWNVMLFTAILLPSSMEVMCVMSEYNNSMAVSIQSWHQQQNERQICSVIYATKFKKVHILYILKETPHIFFVKICKHSIQQRNEKKR